MENNRNGNVAISQEGAAALHELAKNLRTNNENIMTACDTLQKTVCNLGDDIGIYEEAINERIAAIKAAQTKSLEDIGILAAKTEELAAKVEEMVHRLLD